MALGAQARGGGFVRRPQDVADGVQRAAVDLLRHVGIAAAQPGLQMRHRGAFGGGPYHFFERSSRSAAASSICSASSFFSLAFSSSSDRSRLASETSSPPYFDFHF